MIIILTEITKNIHSNLQNLVVFYKNRRL